MLIFGGWEVVNNSQMKINELMSNSVCNKDNKDVNVDSPLGQSLHANDICVKL